MNQNLSSIYITLAVVWIAHFLVDFMIGIWPIFKTMAHIDLALAGLISALSAVLGEGLQAIFGTLSDRGYRRILILFGLIATVASTLLVYTHHYVILFVFYLVTCAGSGAFHPAAVGLLSNLTNTRKGLFITLFQSGGALGLAFSQLIFTESYHFLEGHTVFLAIPSIFLALYIAYFGIVGSKTVAVQSKKKFNVIGFLQFFKNKDLSLLYVSQVCNQALTWGVIFLLPDILVARGYEHWIAFGGGHMCYILGGAVMMIPAGYVADKYSCKSVIVIASVIGLMTLYAFLYFPLMPGPYLLAVLFLLGASVGLVNPIQIALGNRLVPQNTGMVSAFLMGMAWIVSEPLGQLGGGLLTRCFEHDVAAKALGCLGILLVVGIVAACRLTKDVENSEKVEYSF
jgi:MFS transporter, FSR family, fosmidomycin resistance protein